MAKTDNRFKRMNDEYQSVCNAQDKSFEEKSRELLEVVMRNNDMLDAIIEHLGVPYTRRPATSRNEIEAGQQATPCATSRHSAPKAAIDRQKMPVIACYVTILYAYSAHCGEWRRFCRLEWRQVGARRKRGIGGGRRGGHVERVACDGEVVVSGWSRRHRPPVAFDSPQRQRGIRRRGLRR